ncbi:hypothetical protein K443DRAFT_158546 [Laccaria amethystina LaAM-08-1]|uniref:Uncharacterized protein n=1 Tax=Laccaria amethystina LaAM-08-1 TaxID=1095629 RepID=A0A0C9XDU5_9AGAR|nr:hypothetical protein K443DRAFT_158546 [Laccaria amethystina LaAM-08-1]
MVDQEWLEAAEYHMQPTIYASMVCVMFSGKRVQDSGQWRARSLSFLVSITSLTTNSRLPCLLVLRTAYNA